MKMRIAARVSRAAATTAAAGEGINRSHPFTPFPFPASWRAGFLIHFQTTWFPVSGLPGGGAAGFGGGSAGARVQTRMGRER